MIERIIAPVLLRAAQGFPVVTLLGPRQSGKTTLVRSVFPDHGYLNMEEPETRALFREDPRGLLRRGTERLIVDEVQREPEVLSWIQTFADQAQEPGQFVITGSNQPALGAPVSQSLAGRTSVHYLLPLSCEELAAEGMLSDRDEQLFRGFLPRLYTADIAAPDLYGAYLATYVERDVRRLINVRDLSRFESFLRLLAGRVGQLVNLSSLAGELGVTSTTLAGWVSALEASFVVFRLPPYHANLGKRVVKTPKLYFTEPGLLAWLLQIEDPSQVSRDPLLGNLFENMVVIEAAKAAYNRGLAPQLSFYRDKSGMEVDLVREHQRRPLAIEIKAGATVIPEMIRGVRAFLERSSDALGGALIYSGESKAPLGDIAIHNFAETAGLLFGPGKG